MTLLYQLTKVVYRLTLRFGVLTIALGLYKKLRITE